MRFRLRTLLVAVTILPPLLALAWWGWQWHLEQQRKREFDELIELITTTIAPDTWNAPLPPLTLGIEELPDRGEPLPLVESPTEKDWEDIVRRRRPANP
jgi:hypothetical protein